MKHNLEKRLFYAIFSYFNNYYYGIIYTQRFNKCIAHFMHTDLKERTGYTMTYNELIGVTDLTEENHAPQLTEDELKAIKEAKAEYHREYQRKNRERINEYHRNYAKKNRSKINRYQREYYATHKETVQKAQRRYWLRKKREALRG